VKANADRPLWLDLKALEYEKEDSWLSGLLVGWLIGIVAGIVIGVVLW
jgi:hypothetical protein